MISLMASLFSFRVLVTSLLAIVLVSLVETEFIIVILRGEALEIELAASLIVLTAGSAETACANLVVPTSTAS